jgi:3-phenylpropionate/trans-cinnamate dioxygenase ferredoxin component
VAASKGAASAPYDRLVPDETPDPTSDAVDAVAAVGVVDLGDQSDLPDGKIRVFPAVGNHGVVLCRVAGELYAVEDNCSHRDARLSEGRLRGTLLTCPLHGAQFDVRTGAHQGPPASVPIACFPVSEAEGVVVVHLGGDAT